MTAGTVNSLIALEFLTQDYTEEIENLIWSAFSEFQFFITSCEFDFWIHSSSCDVCGVKLI